MAGQLFGTSSVGGYYASFNLSKELFDGVQASVRFRQHCDIKDAWNTTRTGQTFTWDTIPTITRAQRRLTETNTIPAGQHTVLQGTCTMYEHGLAVPYTEMLEKLSMVSVRAPIMRVLKYDASVDLDAEVHTQFNLTPLRYVGTTSSTGVLTTNGTATATNTSAFNASHVKNIVDTMKSRNIPTYENGDYYAIARPSCYRTLKNALETLHSYTETGLTMIMNGEIGRYEQTRFIEQTSVPTGGAADTATFNAFTETGDAWNDSAAQLSDWVFVFGSETVAEAANTFEEIRAKVPDDFGRSKGIAWYALLGYGLSQTDATQARIIKFDSAA
jgi:ribosomal protein S13